MAVLRGEPSVAGHASTQLVELNLKTGRATLMGMDGTDDMVDMVESPQVDPRRVGQAARHLPSTSTWKGDAGSRGSHHGVQRLDLVGGKLRRFDYGDHMVVEKHLMVPRRGREAELDAMYWTLQALETGRWRRQRCRTNCRLRFIGTSPYNFQAKLLFAPSPLKGR